MRDEYQPVPTNYGSVNDPEAGADEAGAEAGADDASGAALRPTHLSVCCSYCRKFCACALFLLSRAIMVGLPLFTLAWSGRNVWFDAAAQLWAATLDVRPVPLGLLAFALVYLSLIHI